jgi:hypothetical protein
MKVCCPHGGCSGTDEDLAGIDTVMACVGRNAIDKQISLIKWAIESGVTRFFPSEYGNLSRSKKSECKC